MSATWPVKKLQDIADIRVSNVDKKVHSREKPVKLCNYMDVYTNEYITSEIQFMEASASTVEIERFSLKSGDVIITKDSESPDDIGIPTVILEDIENLVCGYHLAMIRPDKELVDPVYLAKQISTSQIARYFSLRASGSTRFGLPIGAVEGVEIPTPPKPEQEKIAEILSTIDKAIEQTEALIAKQQRIKTGLIQDLLTRGIDEHGNIRTEETHEFKDSPLGRLPVGWEVSTLKDVSIGGAKNGFFKKPELVGSGYKLINVSEIYQPFGIDTNLEKVERVDASPDDLLKYGVDAGDLFFTRSSLVLSGIAHCNIIRTLNEPTIFECHVMRIRPNKEIIVPEFLALFCQSNIARLFLMSRAKHVTMATISQPELEALYVPVPQTLEEQSAIAGKVLTSELAIRNTDDIRRKFNALKTALMQDLLSSKVRVTKLLKQKD